MHLIIKEGGKIVDEIGCTYFFIYVHVAKSARHIKMVFGNR